MIKYKFLPYILALLLLGSLSLHAAPTDTERLHNIVDTKVHAITDILNDASIDKPQKNVKIMDIAEEMIDFEIMAKLSLGKSAWGELKTPEEQKEFIDLFVTRIKNSYLEKLYLYNGQKVRIEPAKQTKSTRIEVPSYIIGQDGETEILYKFYRNKAAQWFIYDIDIAGVS
ncbi:MAG: ABC transporter substrate-binding protein, partial [Sulfurimonadaceae bacterium]|nr:ABC transporter substrate-binding protein [Sulfurimonadaceae bacterium]